MGHAARSTANRNSRAASRGDSGTAVTRVFDELDEVRLTVPHHDDASGRDLPAGARGTVVGIWRGGQAYEVEFTQPFACLLTLRPEELAA